MPRQRIPTYVQGFDEALSGGVPEGYVVLVSGAPGTMKSSLVFNVLYGNALEKGVRSAYFTLEQSKDMLLDHMSSLGFDDKSALEKIMLLDMGNVRKNLAFLKAKRSWIELFKMYVKNLLSSEPVSILAVDSLDVLETMARFEDRRTELFYLFEWLRELKLTSFLISEKPMDLFSVSDHYDEAYLADGIIHVGLYPTSEVYVQRRIRCVKMRATKHEPGYHALIFEDGRFEATRAMSGTG